VTHATLQENVALAFRRVIELENENAKLRAALRDLIDWMPRVVPAVGQEAEWEKSLERACEAYGPLGHNANITGR